MFSFRNTFSSYYIAFVITIYRVITILILHATNLAFAKIPIGLHTLWACVAVSLVAVLISFLLRRVISSIVPFEALFVAFLGFILSDVVYGMIKFIPVKDKRTGQTKSWAIGKNDVNSLFLFLTSVVHLFSHTTSLKNKV